MVSPVGGAAAGALAGDLVGAAGAAGDWAVVVGLSSWPFPKRFFINPSILERSRLSLKSAANQSISIKYACLLWRKRI